MADELLTNRDAASYIAVTSGTLHVWRCENRYPIPFLRIGSKIRYRKSDLDKFLASRLVKPHVRARSSRRRANKG